MATNNSSPLSHIPSPLNIAGNESGRVVAVDENKVELNLWGEVITPKLEALVVRSNPTKKFTLNFGQGYVLHGVITGPSVEGVDAVQKQVREMLKEGYGVVAVEHSNLAAVDWTEG